VGPSACLDAVAKRKSLFSCRELNTDCAAHTLFTILTPLVSQSVSQPVSQSVLALRPCGTRDQILAVVKTVAVLFIVTLWMGG